MEEQLGIRIKKLRTEAGITQEKLAGKMQVSRSTVAGWETKNHVPSIQILCSIADFFQVSVDYLVGNSDDR